MHDKHEEIPEGETKMRELEEELEHPEEDVQKRGFFSKTMDIVKKLFTPAKPSEREQQQ